MTPSTLTPPPDVKKKAPTPAPETRLPVSPRHEFQFKNFGVLDAGSQSKTSTATAVVLNLLILLALIAISIATKRTIERQRVIANLVAPPPVIKPIPKPLVKLPPPPVIKAVPPPPVPAPVQVQPPPPMPEPPKPVPQVRQPEAAKPTPPAPPRQVQAAAAPKPVAVNLGRSASVANNAPHPTAVALGQANNPIAPSNRPATAEVNLGQRGLAGMPSSNNGGGPRASAVNLGSGQPNGGVNGNGARAVAGIRLGTGNGPVNSTSRGPTTVNLAQNTTPAPLRPVATDPHVARSAPKVLYKPKPQYTEEARALGLQGNVSVRIQVSPTGQVTVLGVTSGLGHGLDQAAERAILATRFQPAVNASGQPVEWTGVVVVAFQLMS
jgi:protein TonB